MRGNWRVTKPRVCYFEVSLWGCFRGLIRFDDLRSVSPTTRNPDSKVSLLPVGDVPPSDLLLTCDPVTRAKASTDLRRCPLPPNHYPRKNDGVRPFYSLYIATMYGAQSIRLYSGQ